MRETASGGMALSPTGLRAEGLASLCEGLASLCEGGSLPGSPFFHS